MEAQGINLNITEMNTYPKYKGSSKP